MELKMLEINKLSRDFVIRSSMDTKKFLELKDSINESGILFPIVASRVGKQYVVLDGILRLEACLDLGWKGSKKVPVIVVKKNHKEAVMLTLIANTVRSDIDPGDRAEAIKLLMSDSGYNDDQVA